MKRVNRFLLLLAIVVAAVTVPATSGAQASAYDALYVFGDSLSDTGNDFILTEALRLNPAIPPSESPHASYFQGRFSNGPVAFEYLWCLLNRQPPRCPNVVRPFLASFTVPQRGAVSFAFGGSGTGTLDPTPGGFFVPGLKTQVELFRLATAVRRPRSSALYAIFAGANDYLVMPPRQPADPGIVVANIVDAVEKLYRQGARNVMVLNLPDLGVLPLVAGNPQFAQLLSSLTAVHNALLAQALGQLAAHLRNLNLVVVDVYALLQDLPPTINLTTPYLDVLLPPPPPPQLPVSLCLFTDPRNCRDVPTFVADPTYFFWDAEHPTTDVHLLLGQYLYSGL